MSVRGYLVTNDGSLVYELEEEETCIGRAEGNDIVLTASRSISSRHCRLVIKSSGGRTQARMYDLESLNGTFLNDTHICNSHAELRSGDSLRLGYDPTIYRFYLAGEAPADLLGPTAAPPRSSSAAGSPSHGRTAAGRSTNWEGSGAGRSPLKDYERGVGGGGRGRAGDRSTYVSPDRLPPAGVTSEQTGARRRSLTGMSPSSIRARDSMGVGGTLGMGGGRYREPEFDPDSPQGRMAARRRSLSAARAGGGGFSSSSSPWEGTGRPSISPTLRRSLSAAPSRSHHHPPHPPSHQAAAGRSTSGGGGGRGWSSTHSPPSSGLKPREKPFSVGYPSATSGGHRRVEEEGGGGGGRGGGQPPRHGSSSSSSSSSSSDGGGHSHIQPKHVTPWHVVDEERRRGGGGDHVQEVEPPFARDEDEDRRGGDGGGYYDRDGGGRQGEEEDEREREREEEGEMERERDRAPPPPPQTPHNLKVVGPVSITMAQNGDVESALDSRGEDIRGRGVGGGATPLARSRRPSSASLSITAIGPVTVNPPAAPFTPQQPPVQASTSSSSTVPGGASLQRTAALLASMASEPPLAHSPTLDAAVAASKRAAAGMGGMAGSPRGGIFTSPSGSGAAIEQLSNTIASPRVVGQNKMLASLEAMKLQAAAAAASVVVPAPPPMSIHSPRGNLGPPPPPPTTVATAALANSIHEAELSQRRAAAASAASILAAATAAAAPSSSTTNTSAPLVNPGGGGGGALPFIPPLPLSSTSSALLSRSQLSSLGGTQPLSSTSLATSRIASSMPNALEHLATSTSSRPLASRQGRDSPLRLVLDVLGEEREAVKETLSELKTMVSGRGIPQPQFQPQPPQSQSRQQQQQQQQEPPPPPPAPTFTPQQRSAALLLGGLLKKAVKVRLREAFDVWHQHSQVAAAEDDYRVRDELARMLEERRGAILAAVAEEERQEMEAERVRFLEAQARAREEEAAARAREEAAERARWEQTVHIDVSPSRLRTSSALRVSTPNKPGAPVYTMGPSGVVHIHPSSSSTAQQQQQGGGGGGGNAAFFPGNSTSSAFNLGGTNTTTTTTSFSNGGGGGGGGGGGAATLSMNATGGSKVSVYADGSISLGNTGGVSQPYPDPQHFPRDERGKEGGNHWADAVATIANDSREPHPVATIIGVEGGGGMGGPGGTYVRLEHSQPAPVSDSTTNTAPKKSFHECTSSRPIWEYAEGPLSTTVSSRAKTRSKSPPAVVRRNSLTALGAGGGGGESVKSMGGGGGFPPGGTSGTTAWQASLRRHSIDASQSSTHPAPHIPYTHSHTTSVSVEGGGGESTPSANSSLPPGFKVVLSPSREPGRGPTVTLTTGQQQQQQAPPPPPPPLPPQDFSSNGGTTLRVHTPGGGMTSISSGGGGGMGASFHPPPTLHIPAPPPYYSSGGPPIPGPAAGAEINYHYSAPILPPPVDPRDIAMEAMLASRDEAVRRLMGSADDQLMRMAVTAAGALNVSNGYAPPPPTTTTTTTVGLSSLIGTKHQQQQLHISVNNGGKDGNGSVLAYPDDNPGGGGGTTFRTSLLTPRGTTVISSRTPAAAPVAAAASNTAATRGRSGFTQHQPPPPLTMNILAPPTHRGGGGGGSWDTSFSTAFPPAPMPHSQSHHSYRPHATAAAAANTTSFSGSMGDKGTYLRAVTPSKGGGSTVTQVHQQTARAGERVPPLASTWDDPLASFGGGSRGHHHHHNSRDPLASFRGSGGGGMGGQPGGGYLTYGGKSSPSSKPFIQLPIAPASLAVSLGLGGQWE